MSTKTIDGPITERDLQRTITRGRWMKTTMLANFTPRDWWECDVIEITRAGYFREYEVKLTLADFRRDEGTDRRVFPRPYDQPPRTEKKHQQLALSDPRGPVEFWYVAPSGIIPREEIPEWAGLIEVKDHGPEASPHWRFSASVTVPAPRLHHHKASPEIRAGLLESCYYRLHRIMKT